MSLGVTRRSVGFDDSRRDTVKVLREATGKPPSRVRALQLGWERAGVGKGQEALGSTST